MTNPDLRHLVARGLQTQPVATNANNFGRVGWGQVPVTEAYKREKDEMQAVPLPMIILGACNFEGMDQLLLVVNSNPAVEVGLIWTFIDDKTTRFHLKFRRPGAPKFEDYGVGETYGISQDSEKRVEDISRVFEYAKLSTEMGFDLLNTANGVGRRMMCTKQSQNLSQRSFSYVRKEVVVCVSNLN